MNSISILLVLLLYYEANNMLLLGWIIEICLALKNTPFSLTALTLNYKIALENVNVGNLKK